MQNFKKWKEVRLRSQNKRKEERSRTVLEEDGEQTKERLCEEARKEF